MRKRSLLISFIIFMTYFTPVAQAKTYSSDGDNGWDGSHGQNSYSRFSSGGHGGDGEDGANASNISVTLQDQGPSLIVLGQIGNRNIQETISIEGEHLKFSAEGGYGGDGGRGGSGYNGQEGRDGQDGRAGRRGKEGRDGQNGTRYSPNGGNGTDGGDGFRGYDGEDGEDGEDASPGGNGGRGGNGGDGASITIRYDHPGLLMHLKAYTSGGAYGDGGAAGPGGRGGQGGDGGQGGYGGRGGDGGKGGRGYTCTASEREQGCKDGRRGRDGRDGNRGRSGYNGSDGDDGRSAPSGALGSDGYYGQDGLLTLIHIDENGRELSRLHSLKNIYQLKVLSFEVVDENHDSIFEPGEKFTIKNIKVQNVGGLPAPAGAKLKIHDHELPPLPQLTQGSVWTSPKNVQGEVPHDFPINQHLILKSYLTYRGLPYSSVHFSNQLKIQYPIQLVKVESSQTIAHREDAKSKITLINVSTKDYTHLGIRYDVADNLSLQNDNPVTALRAGEQKTEVITYRAKQETSAFERSQIQLQIFRGDKNYTRNQFNFQFVPKWLPQIDSRVLVLSTGYEIEDYKNLLLALKSLGLKHDLYDLNLHGPITPKVFEHYKNKLIFFALHSPLDILSQGLLFKKAKQNGQVVTFDHRSQFETDEWSQRNIQYDFSYFHLSSSEQQSKARQGLAQVLPFVEKLARLQKAYQGNHQLDQELFNKALIQDIHYEYQVALNNRSHYDGAGHARAYNSYVMAINPAKNFAYRAHLLTLSDHFLSVDDGGRVYRQFKDVLKDVLDAREELSQLAESCGDIRGSYISRDGEKIAFKKSLFGNIKSDFRNLKLKGDDSDNQVWQLEYEVQKRQYQASIHMNCEESLIQIELILPHDQTQVNFIKYSTQREE